MANNSNSYPNSGILFKNDRKNDNVKAPDYKGDFNLAVTCPNCQHNFTFTGWLSAWIKQGAKAKFMSLALKLKDQRQASEPAAQGNDADDSAPF